MDSSNVHSNNSNVDIQATLNGEQARLSRYSHRQPYQFSSEEMKAIRDCQTEAMLYRSLPGAAIGSGAVYMLLKTGIFVPSPRYGYAPKMLFAGAVGYIIGKLSYQRTCAEKLMNLPGSKVGQQLKRMKSGLPPTDDQFSAPGDDSTEVFTKVPLKPIFDDHKPDERDRLEGLDDYHRVTESLLEYTTPEDGGAQQSSIPLIPYDERRKFNRDQYKQECIEKRRAEAAASQDEAPRTAYRSAPAAPLPVGRVNQYGDVVYDE